MILLRGGTVYDGSGADPIRSDILIENGRIVRIEADLHESAASVLDVEGHAVAPGFIDVHSHSDRSYVVQPQADGKIRQGITTEVIGNCGESSAPLDGALLAEAQELMRRVFDTEVDWTDFRGYFARLDRTGLSTNCVALVGHGALRSIAVGKADRPATESERAHMVRLLEESLQAGAWGVSTGLIYVPSSFGNLAELTELAAVAARLGGCYASHIRGEGDTLVEAVQEAIDVAKGSGALVEVSHHKASGRGAWGKVEETLGMMAEARAQGHKVYCDQYPYIASSTGLDAVLPMWVVEGGRAAQVARLKDPEVRAQVHEHLQNHRYGDWTRVMVADVKHKDGPNKRFVGQHFQAIGEMWGRSPEDAVIDLLIEEEGAVAAIYFSMCDEDVDRVMRDPHTVIGSDAEARSTTGVLARGRPHPRTFGTFPRVLGHYVRERGVLSLPEAIHRMTGMPAARFGLRERGLLRPGWQADIVVFDPATVSDEARFDDPYRYPTGIHHVLVNGVPVVAAGQPTGALPGRVLRLGQDGQVPV